MDYALHHGDCLDVIGSLPSASFDAIITDPPYPGIKREYGYWEPDAWLDMMRVLVPQLRRVLKPSGSCVMVLQPNSERVGRMRTWLWHFMAWVGDTWGIVQDAYWWNIKMFPTVHPMRCSLKTCVWLGLPDCYRDDNAVLWGESEGNIAMRMHGRWGMKYNPSGAHNNPHRASLKAAERGGVTPFNVLPMPSDNAAQTHGHGASTPLNLCRWWTRYICPPGGAILDPFCGSGTTGIAALEHGASYVGIERYAKYIPIAEARLAEAAIKNATPQLRMAV